MILFLFYLISNVMNNKHVECVCIAFADHNVNRVTQIITISLVKLLNK